MNILLTGAAGQLGRELLPLLARQGNVVPLDRDAPPRPVTGWVSLDLMDGGALETLLNRTRPDLIVNTAAYTAVDQAESDPETACEINAALPGRLARWAQRNCAGLVHYSTDYIFNGEAVKPYIESDIPDPLSVYGDSKLAGERAIVAAGCRHVILRTSWVYSSHGKNFLLSMLNLARKGLSLKVVDDQRGCPTWARNLALATDAVVDKWLRTEQPGLDGTYHYRDSQALNWYEFARAIFSHALEAGLLPALPDIKPVPSSDFQQPATRPRFSVLDAGKINETFGIAPADFQKSLSAVIGEVSNLETPG
ncbi:MAG: dTDP-4-dehydrorhamnose reductase [Lysobacterales bacterium]|jgi:dTDP-4-dehydrorhamnose reductase